MGEVQTIDATLHLVTDGVGVPITVFAHGLTNSCMELSAFTPMAPGTKVRFCFRGHGHSSTPGPGSYRYDDFARDLEAVADATGATGAVGTSLGAGALANLLETLPRDEAIDAISAESGQARNYETQPGLRDFDLLLWQDMNPVGIARAIREVVRDAAVADLGLLGEVHCPTLVIAREGDTIHPASVAHRLADHLPNAEAFVLNSEDDLLASIPMLVERVSLFLAGAA